MSAPIRHRQTTAPVGRVVADVQRPGVSSWDLDGSLAPAPPRQAAAPAPSRSWLAPAIFLLGLFLAAVGALLALLATAVLAGVVALLLMFPRVEAGPGVEFIIVPDTRPVQAIPVEAPVRQAPAKAAPRREPVRRSEAPAVQQAPVAAPPVEVPAAPAVRVEAALPAEPRGAAARVRLESVPLDEAIQRVKGKAGRGEARAATGQ